MAERDYVRGGDSENTGRFSEAGGGSAGKSPGVRAGRKLYEKKEKALREFAKSKKLGTESKHAKLENFVSLETPKPPVDAEWQGEEKPKPEDETWGKYIDPPPGDQNAKVHDTERKALHDSIKKFYVGENSKPPEGEPPVAIVMMGGSGSGKSSLLKGLDKSKFVHVDPDGVKEKLPEFRDGVRAKMMSAAGAVHEESGHVAKNLRDETMKEGRNMIYDGTGGDEKKYGEFIDRLKNGGPHPAGDPRNTGPKYKVEVRFSHLPLEKAEPRIKGRAEQSGRHVPVADYQKNHASVPKNWHIFSKKADTAVMYDTDVPKGTPPKKVWSVSGGVDTHHDEAFVSSYKSRYGGGS
jgi:GTPase SAR1 family protein